MPKKISFSWFAGLINDMYSLCAAYLVYAAIRKTCAVIQAQRDRVIIEPPEVVIIGPSDPRYRILEKYPPQIKKSSSLSKFDDPFEFEFSYLPDYLGFYLAQSVNYEDIKLKAGIYLVADRVVRDVKQLSRIGLNLDPNTVIGTVLYHEYMHMLFDTLGLKLRSRKLSKLSGEDLEETACEGLNFLILPQNIDNMLATNLLLGIYLAEREIEGNINISFRTLTFKFHLQGN